MLRFTNVAYISQLKLGQVSKEYYSTIYPNTSVINLIYTWGTVHMHMSALL